MISSRQDVLLAMRRFSRFCDCQIRQFDDAAEPCGFSRTEVRILSVLSRPGEHTLTALCQELELGLGYASRILRMFVERGLIERFGMLSDGRKVHLALTDAGRQALTTVDEADLRQAEDLVSRLGLLETETLMRAMGTTERLMGQATGGMVTSYRLRGHQVGDIGWIAHRHGVLYAQEFGWDHTFEILVAEILAGIVRQFDPVWEQSLVVDSAGDILGSAFVVRALETVAKLRLVYVEPSARGLGIGRRLVDESVRFARAAGYRTMTLWTHDVLLAARHLYQEAGFALGRLYPAAPMVAGTCVQARPACVTLSQACAQYPGDTRPSPAGPRRNMRDSRRGEQGRSCLRAAAAGYQCRSIRQTARRAP